MNKKTSQEFCSNFNERSVPKAVLKQLVPSVCSQMIALFYNLADTFFVGRLNDPIQTASVTVVTSSFLLLTALSNLFGIGSAGMVGQKEGSHAKTVISVGFHSALWTAFLFSLTYFCFRRPLLVISGATTDTLFTAEKYASFAIVLGGPFTIFSGVLSNLLRAEGHSFMASFGSSIGGILNNILDLFFVLPRFLNLGISGAAIATAISSLCSFLFFLIELLLRKGRHILSLSHPQRRNIRLFLPAILKTGLASAVQYVLTVVVVTVQSYFMAMHSIEAVAVLGICKKLDNLLLYFSIGTANGLLPILAYIHAANDRARQRSLFLLGCTISAAFSLLCLIAYEIGALCFTSLFIRDHTTLSYAVPFLRRMVIAMPFMAVVYPLIILFQTTGYIKEALIVSFLRKGSLDIPPAVCYGTMFWYIRYHLGTADCGFFFHVRCFLAVCAQHDSRCVNPEYA